MNTSPERSYLREFVRAYLECALWASTDIDTQEPLDDTHSVEDIAPRAFREAVTDCRDFIDGNRDALDQTEGSAEQHGHDFWLTRNRHGAGFWDRGYGKLGDELTKDAHAYGGCDLYVGDDGKIYGF
jgi:hypothetical protein